MPSISGVLTVWENGRAILENVQGKFEVDDPVCLDNLISNVIATAFGDLAFKNDCTVTGTLAGGRITKVESLVLRTEAVDYHVRGSAFLEK